MNQETINVCIEKAASPIRVKTGEEMAIVNNWENGRTLRVYFYPGNSFVQDQVRRFARVWEEYANIKFDFVNDKDAEIRVSFVPDGTSWSAVGKDALNTDWFPKDQPTMNYGWLTKDSSKEEFSRVITHEFGHALGCIHEHQNPKANIPWNKEAVYRYYAERGWNKALVDQNIFRRYDQKTTKYSDFDPDSIMLYAIDKRLTDGKYEVGWNTELSDVDIRFIREIYPKPKE